MSWRQSSSEDSDGYKYSSIHCNMNSSLHVKYPPKITTISRKQLPKATRVSGSQSRDGQGVGVLGFGLVLGGNQHPSAALPCSGTCRQGAVPGGDQLSCPVGPTVRVTQGKLACEVIEVFVGQ